MTEYNKNKRAEFLKNHKTLLFFILHGLGGCIKLSSLYTLLQGRNRSSEKILKEMEQLSLIRVKWCRNFKIVCLRSPVYEFFGIAPRLALSDYRVDKSLAFYDIYIHTYGTDIERLSKAVSYGNLCWYKIDSSLNLMTRIYSHVHTAYPELNLDGFLTNINLFRAKTEFLTQYRKSKRIKLNTQNRLRIEDLHTLMAKGVYILNAEYRNILILNIAILCNSKRKEVQLMDIINRELPHIFYGLRLQIKIKICYPKGISNGKRAF